MVAVDFPDTPTTGQVFDKWTWNGTAWVLTRVGGKWRRVAVQGIVNSTTVAVAWDTEDADSHGFATPPASNITIPAGCDGVYSISGGIGWATTPSANSFVRVQTTLGGVSDTPCSQTGQQGSFCRVEPMVAGNILNISVFQASGAAVNINGFLHVTRVTA